MNEFRIWFLELCSTALICDFGPTVGKAWWIRTAGSYVVRDAGCRMVRVVRGYPPVSVPALALVPVPAPVFFVLSVRREGNRMLRRSRGCSTYFNVREVLPACTMVGSHAPIGKVKGSYSLIGRAANPHLPRSNDKC